MKNKNIEPLVSIVANFYKSEKYIPKLIKSVLSQTFVDFELICVNDCSPLHDLAVIKRYAECDDRIRIIDNKINLGICKAKMEGIRAAKGKYLMFIDGDDWLESDAIKSMVEPAEKYDLDLVIMNSQKVLPVIHYKKVSRSKVDCYGRPIYMPEVRDRFFINFFGEYIFGVAYWGKLYSRQMLLESHFVPPENIIAEDFVFNMRVFPYVKSMMFVDYIGYNWRWGGITSGKKNNFWTSENMLLRSNEVYKESINLIEKYNYEKARIPLLRLQENNLKGNISSMAKYSPNSKEATEIKSLIKELLEPSFYEDFSMLNSIEIDDFSIAVLKRDVDYIYNYCHQIFKASFKTRLIKKAVHLLLYPLASI